MYSEQDLRDAVSAGAISENAAEALRAHVAAVRETSLVDEENFRLVNSFNDIFVTIAVVILLVAMGGIGSAVWDPLGSLLVAAAAWGLAEFFTRKRRMALPSIVLLIAFVGGIFGAGAQFAIDLFDPADDSPLQAVIFAVVFLITAFAAWLHWRRFQVPITVAAGAGSVVGLVIALVAAVIFPIFRFDAGGIILPLIFVGGLVVFAYAMKWDMSDRARKTRRSDVAFWLHLLAAPMIAHPLFYWFGVFTGGIGAAGAVVVLLAYIVFAAVALAVDRRALLVSALAYVLYAMGELFSQFGVVELNVAITALVIGSALLSLSAFWTPIRGKLLARLPEDLTVKLPWSPEAATG